ncbi:uncharacterized protein LOC103850422 [Brassica rapa]|uniref:DUF3741 domain-containing protein n=2 Tax=Brassica TaxID=3705 RepID=A0ABQ8ASD8_BRANA|nr:uncharacterized protein LOC103850422 [Brassica rapa]XP_013640126.2 uncharacterized protein LOC106345469 [Brassica napus]KAH0895427.1 hypothetical protein HID58_044995 [Brassica napus]
MTQRANPKTGCLTAVVRRLLCSGSQQTHPSDNILDSDETLQLLSTYEEIEEPKKETKTETQTQEDDVSPPPPPNVVAKLMGLDDPAPGSNRFRYFDDSGSAVARSKSVNFMDYILRVKEEEEEDEKDGHLTCRRVRASVSFREIVPTSARSSSNQQQKKHDFLLMYLDKLDEKRELVGSSSSSRSKRFEKVLEDSKKPPLPPPEKKKENEKVAKKFKDERRKVAKKKKKSENGSDHVNGAKKVRWFLSPSKSKSTEKMALLGGGGGECKNIPADEFSGKETESPENKSNASPVSVLDRDLYDYLILDDDYYFSGDSESASELSTKQVETTAAKSSCSSSPARTRTNSKKENNNNTNSDSEETEFITKLMNMLSDLSEEDMKSSTWVSTSSTKPVDYTQVEDFCVEFGQEILDLVMDQLVDELLYLV